MCTLEASGTSVSSPHASIDRLRELRGETAYQRIPIRDIEPQLDELVGVQAVGGSDHVCMEAEQIIILESNEVVIIRLLEIHTLTNHAFHSEGHRHFAHCTGLALRVKTGNPLE